MVHPDSPAGFVSANERLRRILSEPELRARVDTILAEQRLIDDRYRDAVRTLRHIVATPTGATGTNEATDTLEELQRRLANVGVREVGITLTYGDHAVTVPLEQILAAPDN